MIGPIRLIAASIAVALAGLILVGSASARMFEYGNPAFCAPKKPVRDFGLSGLPALREAPESARDLGHGAVAMYPYGDGSRVMPNPEPFGYSFTEGNYSGSVLLDWTVTARLWTIDKRGTAFREVDRARLAIGRLNSVDQPGISVDPLENRRGFYRFDMEIANRSGEVLGSYSAHFKVVRPTWKPRLELTRDAVRPGQRILIRVANYGSETVSYGEPFGVQRFETGRWVQVPGLERGPWRMWLGLLPPGKTSRCSLFSLPAEIPPGRYRVVKRVGTEAWRKDWNVQLSAPFEVIDPGADIEY